MKEKNSKDKKIKIVLSVIAAVFIIAVFSFVIVDVIIPVSPENDNVITDNNTTESDGTKPEIIVPDIPAIDTGGGTDNNGAEEKEDIPELEFDVSDIVKDPEPGIVDSDVEYGTKEEEAEK